MSCFENQMKPRKVANECECNGLIKTLKTILKAQRLADCIENEEETCDRPILGPCGPVVVCNTRPVQLYPCTGGTPIVMDYVDDEGVQGFTDVFRIEKINDCTCTFRCLAPNPNPTVLSPYIKTDTFFTVDLNCCCYILKCLPDTHVECL